MKTIYAGLAMALALALAFSPAWAADIEGKVQKVDTVERTIVLEDGTQIWVAEGVSMEGLTEGASVKASFEERDGKKVATELKVGY